jgi:hypothetical protein
MQDGTYIISNGQHLPVTPQFGYFVAVSPNTRMASRAPFIGVWTSPDGVTMEEPSTWLPTRHGAERRGRAHQQYSIWDCTNLEEIKL